MSINKERKLQVRANSYAYIPVDISMKEGSVELAALRGIAQAEERVFTLARGCLEILDRLPEKGIHPIDPEPWELAVSRCYVGRRGGDSEYVDWTVPSSTYREGDPLRSVELARPRENHLKTDVVTAESLTRFYEELAEAAADSLTYGAQLDAWLREDYGIPDAVQTYTAQSISGVRGWMIRSTPERHITLPYVEFD